MTPITTTTSLDPDNTIYVTLTPGYVNSSGEGLVAGRFRRLLAAFDWHRRNASAYPSLSMTTDLPSEVCRLSQTYVPSSCWIHALMLAYSMVTIVGYTIEHEELIKFLNAQGWGPDPGELELSIYHVWMTFVSWRCSQPRPEDVKKPLPRPQYWYDKDENEIHALMTRYSSDRDNWQILRFREMPIDIETRDRLIAQKGNVLDPDKMWF